MLMGSTWNCSAGALHLPSAGIHAAVCQGSRQCGECEVRQPIIGLGEGHIFAYSSHSGKISTTIDCRLRSSVQNGGILASRRKIRKRSLNSQSDYGNSLGAFTVRDGICKLGCLNLGWSQRFTFSSIHAHNNNSSKNTSSESPRFDREEDADRDSSHVFQDLGKQTNAEDQFAGDQYQANMWNGGSNDGSATDNNGHYQKLSSTVSNASDLFREEKYTDDEEDTFGDSADNENGAGYESWSEESEPSSDNGSSGSVGSAADSLAIGGKEPVYQVRASCCMQRSSF